MTAYSENFQSYTPNANVFPTGWHEFSNLQGEVINNMGGGKVSNDNGYFSGPADSVWIPVGGGGLGTSAFGAFVQGTNTFGIIDDGASQIVAMYFQFNLAFADIAAQMNSTALGTDPVTGVGDKVSWLQLENDQTVSAWIVNTYGESVFPFRIASSVVTYDNSGFQSFQVIWKYPTIIIGTNEWLGAQCAVWKDGTLLFTTTTATTDIFIGTVGGTGIAPPIDQFAFSFDRNVGIRTMIDSVFCQTGLAVTTSTVSNTSGFPVYFVDAEGMIWPFSGTGGGSSGQLPPVFAANFTQAAAEVVKKHVPVFRTTQTGVEITKNHKPTFRITQTAVEIIRTRGGGWQVYEA